MITRTTLSMLSVLLAAGLPAQTDKPTSQDKAAAAQKAIGLERNMNLAAFQKKYLPDREGFLAAHPRGWIVIASGKLLPQKRDEKRVMRKLYFEPAKTLQQAIAAANKAAPDARHRFVFRIGEDGDYSYGLGMASGRNVLGGGFLQQLPGEVFYTGNEIWAHDRTHRLQLKMDPPGSFRLKPTIGVAGSKPSLVQAFQLSNVFTGTATVSRELAAKLKLELWEIPGKVAITGAMQRGTLRRSRLVMKFKNHADKKNKDAWHQIITPVAVWQR